MLPKEKKISQNEWDSKLEVANVNKTLFIPNVVSVPPFFFKHVSRDERGGGKDLLQTCFGEHQSVCKSHSSLGPIVMQGDAPSILS